MIPRMVEVSKFNGKTWEPSGNAVFHGFFPDYEEFAEGPGNYPAALIEWEDGKVESVVAHSIRFLVPTLTLEAVKEAVRADWLSKEMRTPAKGFPAIRAIEPGVPVIIRTKDTNQAMWDGVFGIVESKFAKSTGSDLDLWWVNIEGSPKGTGVVLSGKHLEVRG